MNRIILIGNGFDLAHGLKTSYKDFIDDYWEGFMNLCIGQDVYPQTGIYKSDPIELKMPANQLLSSYLPEKENKYILPNKLPVSYNEIIEFIGDFNQENKGSSVGEIQFSICNKFLLHLLEKCNKEMGWVDIENEYYKFLCGNFDKSISQQYQLYYVEDLNPDFEHIKQKLSEYLRKLLDDKQIGVLEKVKNIVYSPFYVDEFTEKGKDELISIEAQRIEDFKTKNRNDESFPIKMLGLLSNIPTVNKEFCVLKSLDRKFWERYFDLKPDDMMFLSFNYTNTEMLYIDKNKAVDNKFVPSDIHIHIHGELNNPNNPIIFGYGDELEENYSKLENLQDNAYLENIKSIKYQETNNYKQMLNFINSDKYQVIILGHSCGNSDRTLLNTLFEHENCVSIKPYYYRYKDKETGEIKDNYSDIVRNISRSFTDKKSMRDKVVNKTYTTWFSED